MSKQQLTENVAKAAAQSALALKAYNDTWKKDPTAANWPAIDKALDRLQEAELFEHEERRKLAFFTKGR